MRARITAIIEYDIRPHFYGVETLEECIAIDRANFDHDPGIVADMIMTGEKVSITVEGVDGH